MPSGSEKTIEAAVNDLFVAYRNRDLDGAVACYAPEDDVISLGPAGNDAWVGVQAIYNFLSRAFSQSHEVQCQYMHANANLSGRVAWTIGQFSMAFVTGRGSFVFQGRYTSVLEVSNERLLIRQNQFAMPSADKSFGGVFPADQGAPPPSVSGTPGSVGGMKPPPPPVT